MTDIIERLRFDAARCQAQFSRGVATNIEEAMAEIERLREYACHKHACARIKDAVEKCDCGLDELIPNTGNRVPK